MGIANFWKKEGTREKGVHIVQFIPKNSIQIWCMFAVMREEREEEVTEGRRTEEGRGIHLRGELKLDIIAVQRTFQCTQHTRQQFRADGLHRSDHIQ